MTLTTPPRVSGGDGEYGHLDELASDPIGLFRRVRQECGDAGVFRLADREVVLVFGAVANEAFFRASEDDLDQAAAYPFMTPIFGEGVVFDVSPEERSEMVHNLALKTTHMKQHAVTIPDETERMIAQWGDEGEVDLLEFFAELTMYTSAACLVGKKFRKRLDSRFARLFHDLEKGTDPIAFVDAYADIESFHKRDAARVEIVTLIQEIMDSRIAGDMPTDDDPDLLDMLMSVTDEKGELQFTADTITGTFIALMFAGHHTTSGTAAWTLIELLRHQDYLTQVTAELDELYSDGVEYSFGAMRQIPKLESALKEALRLHPPIIILMRMVQNEFEVQGMEVAPGQTIAVSPAISNRLPDDFPNPDSFDPDRYLEPRQEDLANRWTWIPFGGGRRRCVGSQFAIMQLKAIFSVLLQNYEFEMTQPSESYRNDHSKMVVQLAQPCTVKYRRRSS